MKSPPFQYIAATTVDEALAALAEHWADARVLAGGQSLVPLLHQRLVHPRVLVDINGVEELGGIAVDGDQLRIGATVRQDALVHADEIRRHAPLLAEAAALVGHVAVRHRGTIGGSLAFGDPAAELPAAALALDAEVVFRGRDGERVVAATDLYTEPFVTVIRPDELLTEVRVPLRDTRDGSAFREVSRRAQDPALVGAAVALSVNGGTSCDRARVAVCGAGPTPLRLTTVEDALEGTTLEDLRSDEAAASVADAVDPVDSIHGSAAYRRRLARVVVRRALDAALSQLSERSSA